MWERDCRQENKCLQWAADLFEKISPISARRHQQKERRIALLTSPSGARAPPMTEKGVSVTFPGYRIFILRQTFR